MMDHAAELYEVEQIKKLEARYFRLMDTRQWEQLGDCFTSDYQFAIAERLTASSRQEMVARASTLRGVTVHQGHMPEIELTGPDTATGIWAAFGWADLQQSNLQNYGHYQDEYEKGADGRWRIKRSHLTRLRSDPALYRAQKE